MTEEFVVELEVEDGEKSTPFGVLSLVWTELSGGVGPWGAVRPWFTIILSLVPFLYLGQHFNGEHRKAFDWFIIQFPLIVSIILWPILYIWSIIDAVWVSSGIVATSETQENLEIIG